MAENQNKWVVSPEISHSAQLEYPELPKIIAQLLLDRGIKNRTEIDNFLNPDYHDLHDPFMIQDMRKAIERIILAIQEKQSIIIFGDYDADGVSGSMILYQAISNVFQVVYSKGNIGVIDTEVPKKILDIYIPDRVKEGYGLSDEALGSLLKNSPDVVITVDCGVNNHKQIKTMQDDGVDVIVIDHHSVPQEMPPAYAIVVPKRNSDPYPFKDLSGAGLAFKTASALIKELRFKGYAHLVSEGYEKWFLDFAAIGTIADMVPLKGENRVLVKYGLHVLAKTKNKGLMQLMKKIGIRFEVEEMVEEGEEQLRVSVPSVGFQIAPRINAAGRINHANQAINLFREKREEQIQSLVDALNSLNDERKQLTEKVYQEVEQRIQNYGISFEHTRYIMEGDSSWPSGVVGIVASRLAKKYHKPAIIYQRQMHKCVASMRSIKGFDFTELMQILQPHLIAGGGHTQAAGMSFREDELPQIKDILSRETEKKITKEMMVPTIYADAKLTSNDVTWTTYDLLSKLAPYGIGNESPTFLFEDMIVTRLQLVGNEKQHLQIDLQSEGELGVPVTIYGIGFNLGRLVENIYLNDNIDIMAKIEVNDWQDQRKLQLNIIDIKRSNKNGIM